MKDFDTLFTEEEKMRIQRIQARKRVASDVEMSPFNLLGVLKNRKAPRKYLVLKLERKFKVPLTLVKKIYKTEGIYALEEILKETNK